MCYGRAAACLAVLHWRCCPLLRGHVRADAVQVNASASRVSTVQDFCDVYSSVREVMSGESALHRKMYYLDVSLEIPPSPNLTVTPVYLKKNILEAVRSLFGEEGAKSPVDILKISPTKRRFILRCPRNSYVRLRTSLTLSTTYEGKTCVYTVHRASPNLLSFTADSRTYQHGEVPLDSSSCH